MSNLPKIHLIGDSISVHYGPYLAEELKNIIQFSQKEGEPGNLDIPTGANGGNSSQVLNYLHSLVTKNFKTDFFVINCGLHDIKRMPGISSTMITLQQYKKNLEQIVEITLKLSKKLMWVSTTPVDDAIHTAKTQAFQRKNSDVLEFNSVAEKIMEQHNVKIIDLYAFIQTLPKPWYDDHVHYPEPIRKLQAIFIAKKIINEEIKITQK
jgi:lysophospholipase L1-like esterase